MIRIGDRNPLLSATYDYQREYVTRTFNTIYGEYEFIKDLKFKSTFSYDYVITKGKDWSDPRTSNGDDINGGMSKKYYEYNKMVWANQVSYKTSIARDHHIDALVGYEIDDQYRDYLSGYATNFATHDKNQISNGMKTESVGGNDTRTRMVSYLTRLNYDYKNKYYLGGSFRTDGSSRFQRDNRWGSFWSISGAWRIIEEKFMSPTKDWLTDLKIRASYGVNGTLPSDYFGYMGLSSLTNGYLEQPGIIQSQLRNDDLQWETNYNLNLGLDFALWNRINVTLEYYTRIEAGGTLAGGHSIADSDVKYGLSVMGTVHPEHIYSNNTGQPSDVLILTKKLGVGLVCNANRVGEAPLGAIEDAVSSMTTLNKAASEISHAFDIHACTDVTGFSFLGHLSEMLNDDITALIDSISIPVITGALRCADEFFLTAAAQRNRNHVGDKVCFAKNIPFSMEEVLFDPQTSGGLLFAVKASEADAFLHELKAAGLPAAKVGRFVKRRDVPIYVN